MSCFPPTPCADWVEAGSEVRERSPLCFLIGWRALAAGSEGSVVVFEGAGVERDELCRGGSLGGSRSLSAGTAAVVRPWSRSVTVRSPFPSGNAGTTPLVLG